MNNYASTWSVDIRAYPRKVATLWVLMEPVYAVLKKSTATL